MESAGPQHLGASGVVCDKATAAGVELAAMHIPAASQQGMNPNKHEGPVIADRAFVIASQLPNHPR